MCSVDCLDQEHIDVCYALESYSEVLTVIHSVTASRQQGRNCVLLWLRRRKLIIQLHQALLCHTLTMLFVLKEHPSCAGTLSSLKMAKRIPTDQSLIETII